VATLVYSDADGIDKTFAVGRDPIVVGRAEDCAIRSEDPRVSRMHARFYLAEGALWVEDLGSSNGVYVGPTRVQKRAPVPSGEIVLVGSLMMRLLPPSGTLPPPIGLHGTLAQWLEMERKARGGVEEERDALARRVGQIHGETRELREAITAHEQDAGKLRDELDRVRKQAHREIEAAKLDAAKAREAKIVAETQAGLTTAEMLAQADVTIAGLRQELQRQRTAGEDRAAQAKVKELSTQLELVTARADRAESDLATAQIRAQGMERELATANAKLGELTEQLKAAEGRVAEADQRVRQLGGAEAAIEAARSQRDEARARAEAADVQLVQANVRAEQAELRAGAADTMAKAMAKDVAEALRRAVDADTRARTGARELDGAHRRAEAAEKRDAERQIVLRDAEQRAAQAEAALVAIRTQLTTKVEAADNELRGKLEQVQRELAEARGQLASAQQRIETAESRSAELSVQAEQLEDKIQDLEAGVAVEQTASASKADEARTYVEKLELQLAEARAAAKAAVKTAADLEKRIGAMDEQSRALTDARAAAEAALTETRAQLAAAQAAAHAKDQALAQVAALQHQLEQAQRAPAADRDSSTAKLKEAAERIVAAERAARDAQEKIAVLQREVDAADNVRQFAASTEREIAQLQRELRDSKAKLSQVMVERDRFETQVRDLRGDGPTRNRLAFADEAEATMQADLGRYTALVARASDLEAKLATLEQEDAQLRARLADAEARAAADEGGADDEPTRTGHTLPLEFAEQLSVIEESIESLRANMRAASDETAVMPSSDSVAAVASAVSQAAEQVERARDALRALTAIVNARS
jgi:chromosome segregation ATPase